MIHLIDVLQSAAKQLNRPIDGDFAKSLWILCGTCDRQTATTIYEACGYRPFCGFPLVRA